MDENQPVIPVLGTNIKFLVGRIFEICQVSGFRDFKIGEKSRQIKLNVAVKLYDMNKGRLVLHNTIYFKVKIKCQGKW